MRKSYYGLELFLGKQLDSQLSEFVALANAYKEMIQNSLAFLNKNPAIMRYVLPSILLNKKSAGYSCVPDPFNPLLMIHCQKNYKIELKLTENNQVILAKPSLAQETVSTTYGPSLTTLDEEDRLFNFFAAYYQEKTIFCLPSQMQNQSLSHYSDEHYYCENSLGIADNSPTKTGNITFFALGGGNDTIQGFVESANIFKLDAHGYKTITGGKQSDLFMVTFFKEDNANPSMAYLSGKNGSDTLSIALEIAIGASDFSIKDGTPHYKLISHVTHNATLRFAHYTLYLSDINRILFNSDRNEVLFLPSGLKRHKYSSKSKVVFYPNIF